MTLKDDVCRCHNENCAERHTCLRWLDRDNGGDWVPHVDSMYSWGDFPLPLPCQNKIEGSAD